MVKRFLPLMAFISVGISACAGGSLRVSSSPEQAEVFLTREGEAPMKLGQTPLYIEETQMSGSRSGYVTISVKKEGYQAESIVVPVAATRTRIEVSSKLTEIVLPQQCLNQSAALDKLSRGIADVQSLIKSRNLESAQNRINNLLNEYPSIPVLYDLMGNVHYINRNLEAALGSYQKSLTLDPTNMDTQRMVNKLRDIVGSRAPSMKVGP